MCLQIIQILKNVSYGRYNIIKTFVNYHNGNFGSTTEKFIEAIIQDFFSFCLPQRANDFSGLFSFLFIYFIFHNLRLLLLFIFFTNYYFSFYFQSILLFKLTKILKINRNIGHNINELIQTL